MNNSLDWLWDHSDRLGHLNLLDSHNSIPRKLSFHFHFLLTMLGFTMISDTTTGRTCQNGNGIITVGSTANASPKKWARPFWLWWYIYIIFSIFFRTLRKLNYLLLDNVSIIFLYLAKRKNDLFSYFHYWQRLGRATRRRTQTAHILRVDRKWRFFLQWVTDGYFVLNQLKLSSHSGRTVRKMLKKKEYKCKLNSHRHILETRSIR